jgi:DNA-directed RNA polymerase subunit RPC12/RpoP
MPVMCPLPSHLAKNLKLDEESNESLCKGHVVCDCLNDEFEIYYYGTIHNKLFKSQILRPIKDVIDQTDTIGIIAKCPKCGHEVLVFDSNIHGYNSFLNKKVRIKRDLYQQLNCLKCNSKLFKIKAEFNFVENDNIDSLELLQITTDKQVSSFDWLNIDILCSSCLKEFWHFIDFETV